MKSGDISSTSEINRGTVSSSPTPSNPVKSGNISSTNELHTINKVNDRQVNGGTVSSSPITSKSPITSTPKTTTNTNRNMNVSETSRTVKQQTFETDSNEIRLDSLSSLSSYYDEKNK